METHDDQETGLPWLAILIVGGLAVLGAITLVQWVIGAVLGVVKLIIFVVVVLAVLTAILGLIRR